MICLAMFMDCYSGWEKEEVREVSRVEKMIGGLGWMFPYSS